MPRRSPFRVRSPWTRALLCFASGTAVTMGCNTEPGRSEVVGVYASHFAPPLLTSATLECDRLLSDAELVLDPTAYHLTFVGIDDCSRAGAGETPFTAEDSGTYDTQGRRVVFTPDGDSVWAFSAERRIFELSLTVPPSIGNLAPVPVRLSLVPRPGI